MSINIFCCGFSDSTTSDISMNNSFCIISFRFLSLYVKLDKKNYVFIYALEINYILYDISERQECKKKKDTSEK